MAASVFPFSSIDLDATDNSMLALFDSQTPAFDHGPIRIENAFIGKHQIVVSIK